MTSRLAFRSAVTDAPDTRAPDQHRVRSTEACICLRAGSDMASGTEPGNTSFRKRYILSLTYSCPRRWGRDGAPIYR